MALLILALAVGSAGSGVAFYSYYEFKRDTTARFIQKYNSSFAAAQKTIDAEKANAKAEIAKELVPLQKIRAEGDTLDALSKKVAPSVFFLSTLDDAGQPSVGSAFAVASDAQQTLLITSYNTVRAATRQPGPAGGIRIRQGDQDVKGTLWTWAEDRDLAVIVLAKGNVPKLSFAPTDPPLKTGERVFAVSGLGAAGGAVTQGFVADVSSAGIQHDAAVGPAFQGGPLVNSDGTVVGVASRAYAPLNFATDGVWFAPLIRTACDKVLKCPSGGVAGVGDRQQPAAPTTTTTVKK